MNLVERVAMPVHFKPIRRRFDSGAFSLLDVGCAGSGPAKARRYLPGCVYSGLDYTRDGLDDDAMQAMDSFYLVNLETDDLSSVPDAAFDAILVSHVIEHVSNGEDVVQRLVPKLRPGGMMYVEFPNARALAVPSSSADYLHFCDDPTHRHVHSARTIANVLLGAGCRIVKAGTRRDRLRLLLTPALFVRGLIKGDPWTRALYDILGCVDYVHAERRR